MFTKDKNFQDKIDSIITHKIIGIPIFAAVIFLVFYISQSTLGTWIADWLVAWIETFQGWVGGLMENANPLLYALLVDGIIGGVGAVVGFLPLVMVMYFLIALLEDCGYMARARTISEQPTAAAFSAGLTAASGWYSMCAAETASTSTSPPWAGESSCGSPKSIQRQIMKSYKYN